MPVTNALSLPTALSGNGHPPSHPSPARTQGGRHGALQSSLLPFLSLLDPEIQTLLHKGTLSCVLAYSLPSL